MKYKTAIKHPDYQLIIYLVILLTLGLIILTSASSVLGYTRFDDNYFFVKKQILLGLLPGIVAFIFFSKFHYDNLRKLSLPIFALMIILLLAVFLPGIGSGEQNGAKSWLYIAGFSFQPAEAAKLALIIYISAFLAKIGKNIQDFKQGFLPILAIGLIPITLVILQPDIGTVSILFAILFSLLFIAGAALSHLGALAGLSLIGLFIMIKAAPYRAARLMTFLHPELDPQGIGYHINQALLALGSGGLFGRGIGQSNQKFQYLPEVHADSIFAIMGEELGFILTSLFLVLLILFFSRMLRIAKYAPDAFSKYVVFGITMWFFVQSMMNILAMVGLLPLTGVPLPFVSHGGTALLLSLASMGIVINISRYTLKK